MPNVMQGAECHWVPQIFVKCVIYKNKPHFSIGLDYRAEYSLARYATCVSEGGSRVEWGPEQETHPQWWVWDV